MVTKKIATHQRAVKLAGHRAHRVATTVRYRHTDRAGTALASDSAPEEVFVKLKTGARGLAGRGPEARGEMSCASS